MGDCNETLRELDHFLDGELSTEARVAIQHHLEGCLDCYSAFDFHAELKQVIARKCASEAVPPGLLDRVKACFGDPDDDRDGGGDGAAGGCRLGGSG